MECNDMGVNSSGFTTIDYIVVAKLEVHGSAAFKAKANAAIKQLKSKPGGKALMNKLENSSNTTSIKEETTGKGNYAQSNGVSKNGKGTGCELYFDPNKMTGGKDAKGSNKRPPYVGLGHEAGHCRAMDLGKQSYDSGSGRPGTTPPSETHSIANENMIRKEHKLPLRPSYY
jgi:hypothetical protein